MPPAGFVLHDRYLGPEAQARLVDQVREVCAAAPLVAPETRWGKKMSVRMTSAGRLGWISDRRGYRYEGRHPSGAAWPPIPAEALAVWRALSGWPADPDCCLVNFYGEGARMGLHRDADENEYAAPVLSISLGDPARFRIGGAARSDPTTSLELNSGDVLIMGGDARLAYHGVDRIRYGESPLLPRAGRLNLTLRVVAD